MLNYIGISGKRGSGKDTVARYLHHYFNNAAHLVAFGDALKAVCAMLSGEHVSNYFTQEGKAALIPSLGLTRGELLQQAGQALRTVHPDIWIKCVDNYINCLSEGTIVVFTDVRYPNEAEYVKSKGGVLIRVEGNPANLQQDGSRDEGHSSETALDHYRWDAVIENTGTLEDLQQATINAALELDGGIEQFV